MNEEKRCQLCGCLLEQIDIRSFSCPNCELEYI